MTSDELLYTINRFYHELYIEAYRICRNHYDAEDAVQAACLRAWEHHRDVVLEKTCRAWMHTIVHHESITILRKQDKVLRCSYFETIAPDCESPEALVGYWYIMLNVKKLTPLHRQVFLLRYETGYSVSAISELLGIPRVTVSSRLRRARSNLRTILSESRFQAMM